MAGTDKTLTGVYWEDVAAAALAIKNGVQKTQLAAAVQSSLNKADSALQAATGLSELGIGRAVCNTAGSSTSKTASIQGQGSELYTLHDGCFVSVYFANGVPAGSTLSISGTGAKPIYHLNAPIKAGVIGDATRALLMYASAQDRYDLIIVDRGVILGGTQAARTADMTAKVGFDPVTGRLFAETALTDAAKNSLLNLVQHLAFADGNGQQYYEDLEVALFPPGQVLSISATFEQGSTVIYDTDTLDDLKPMLTVTATFDDGTTANVLTYELSGTLTEGTSTITVTYRGKMATFSVTVSHYRIIPATYQQVEYIASDGNAYFSISGDHPLGRKYKVKALQTTRDSNGSRVALGGTNMSAYIALANYAATANNVNAFYGTSSANVVLDSGIYSEPTEFTTILTATSLSLTAKNGNTTQSASVSVSASAILNLRFFWDNSSARKFIGRIYSVEVYDTSDNLVADYYPCYRVSDNVIGMYENIGGTFYTSDTSTPFTKGANVN